MNDSDIVRLMREEWAAGVKALREDVDMVMSSPIDKKGTEGAVLSPELKVRHKKSQIRYTVSSVGPSSVILRTPEGDDFLVDKDELEKNYQLD